MQADPRYADVVAEVRDFLRERVAAVPRRPASPRRDRASIPAFGFGKTLAAQPRSCCGDLPQLAALGYPVLVGLSRKSHDRHADRAGAVGERLAGSLALATLAVLDGARDRARARRRGDRRRGQGRAPRMR